MKLKKCLTFLLFSMMLLASTGCTNSDLISSSSSSLINSSTKEFDVSQFFIYRVDNPMCNEYSVCYRENDGSVTTIVELGMNKQSLVIVGERIYYATGTDIVSVNFEGKEMESFHEKTGNDFEDFTFESVDSVQDSWITCTGYKHVEIYGDPVALDGHHFLAVTIKVNTDLTEIEEIDGGEQKPVLQEPVSQLPNIWLTDGSEHKADYGDGVERSFGAGTGVVLAFHTSIAYTNFAYSYLGHTKLENGDIAYYEEEIAFTAPEWLPDQPFYLKVYLPEIWGINGISFDDEAGTRRYYGVYASGLDGSLFFLPFVNTPPDM